MKKLIIFIFLLNSKTLFSQAVPTEALPGCPLFSFCNEKAGQINQSWDDEIQAIDQLKLKDISRISRIRDKVLKWGFPFETWSKDIVPDQISWTSHCINHKNKKAFTNLTFLKNINQLPEGVFLDRMLLLNGDKINHYYRPRDEFPVYFDKNGPYYIKEYNGIYLYYLLEKSGNIKIVPPPYKERIKSQKVICPNVLIENAKKDAFLTYFYRITSCRKIWNYSTQTYHTILLGQRCYN
ncbi:MAG: hypothetical protein H6622_09685 [Halobacteriovoraceae bacterium]|nr:hypothetical protein [Halobacteriovoraceae bacterium]